MKSAFESDLEREGLVVPAFAVRSMCLAGVQMVVMAGVVAMSSFV